MAGRRVVLFAAVWVLTVAGASTLTWTVISSTGTRVGRTTTVAAPDPGAPGPGQNARTWSGRGGRLTARCAGDAVSLGTAVPDVGYWVKVYDPGPATLRVDFESTDPDDYGEVRLSATCVAESPVFRRV